MSRHRPIEVGDIVKFRPALVREPDRPWGAFSVVGFKSGKTVYLRCWSGLRLKAHRRSLEVVMPVEERVAELLMETGA